MRILWICKLILGAVNLDSEHPGRIFVFIDETGDPGHPDSQDASIFYQLNLVVVARVDIHKIIQHISRFRYFRDAGKELEKYIYQEEKLCELLKTISLLPSTELHSFYLMKSSYVGPYLKKIGKGKYDWNARKFRNFVIRKSLERLFLETLPSEHRVLFPRGLEIELVFDRFLQSENDEQNLKEYLRGNTHLPPFLNIVQIDSEYSDMVQLADLLGKLVKRTIIDGTHQCGLDFVSLYCLENPDNIEKRKGPGNS